MMFNKVLKIALFVGISYILTACGGGSSGGGTQAEDTTPPVITLLGDSNVTMDA
ncbi:MAG: hypothetical protein RL113_1270, partial [Pseudomonadota bacterium]